MIYNYSVEETLCWSFLLLIIRAYNTLLMMKIKKKIAFIEFSLSNGVFGWLKITINQTVQGVISHTEKKGSVIKGNYRKLSLTFKIFIYVFPYRGID